MKYLTTKLETIPWVRHGFFTRLGGVSGGIYEGLNCGPGSGDDPAAVAENRARITKTLGLSGLATLWQVHSADVLTVDAPLPTGEGRPKADALVTATPGLGIAVLTADCAPVLFASRKDRIVGAAHAGWKGTVGGVLEATIARMKEMGAKPSDIAASIGPCIGPRSYEVSADFLEPFTAQDKKNERFFRAAEKKGHFIFDLPAYATHRLKLAGVGEVHDTGRDTLPDEASFYSYRRACLRGEKDYGRQISVIALSAP